MKGGGGLGVAGGWVLGGKYTPVCENGIKKTRIKPIKTTNNFIPHAKAMHHL